MDFDKLFPGRFLKSGLFGGKDVTLTIKAIRLEDLPQDAGGTKAKPIVSFHERPLELVLNRTNGESFKAMFGRETDAWIGKRVTLYPAPFTDSFTGEVGTAIRVRGSPDLKATINAEIRLPRKKPIKMRLLKTGAVEAPREEPTPYEPPEPSDSDMPPEVAT